MATTTRTRGPLGLLSNLKDPGIRGFKRGDLVQPSNRSRYNPKAESEEQRLGMGYVKAIALLLAGGVVYLSTDKGNAGRVTMVSGPETYQFDWLETATRGLLMGGFHHSHGRPTYQVALIGFLQLFALYRNGESDQAQEVIERWWMLLRAMDAFAPRADRLSGWQKDTIEVAFESSSAVRESVERVADALECALRYKLPLMDERFIDIAAPTVCSSTSMDDIPVSELVAEPRAAPAASPAAAAASTPEPAAAAGSDTDTTGEPHARRDPAATTEVTDTTAESVASGNTERIFGPYIDRILRAMRRTGALLMLTGPTANGKTTQAVHAAQRLDLGIEVVTLDPGKDAQELIGGYTPNRRTKDERLAKSVSDRWSHIWSVAWDDAAEGNGNTLASVRALSNTLVTALRAIARILFLIFLLLKAKLLDEDDTDWLPVDGPIARWARRAIAGEQVVLVLDELARGHHSVLSMVMGVLNRHSRATVERQGLDIPQGCEDVSTFHIVECWHTRERLVVPADRIRIIATSNVGDKYLGVDMSDPAFRRRWDAWLHLGAYSSDVQATILADKLKLTPGSALITAMNRVAAAVADYQRDTESLSATLDLGSLINWGLTTQARVASDGTPVGQAFAEAAVDVWLDRICPLKGAELDPDARSHLLRVVDSAKPRSL
jgi:MoxR-like ATPase